MKKHHALLLLSLMLFTGCQPPSSAQPPPDQTVTTAAGQSSDTNRQSEQANLYLEAEKYPEAIEIFTAIIARDAANTDAYVKRAGAYLSENESPEHLAFALADYEQARQLAQDLPEAWLGMIDVHIRMDDMETALELAETGYELTGSASIGEKAEQLKSRNITDSDNKTRRSTISDSEDQIIYSLHYRYRTDKCLESVTSYDANNNQIDFFEYQYDDEERMTKYPFFNALGEMDQIYVTFADNGTISERKVYRSSDDTMSLHEIYEYDENGNNIKTCDYNEDRLLLGYNIYTYNNQNQIVLREEFNEQDQMLRYRSIEYNSSGKRIKESSFDPDGTLFQYTVILYDDAGQRLRAERYDANHKLVEVTAFD